MPSAAVSSPLNLSYMRMPCAVVWGYVLQRKSLSVTLGKFCIDFIAQSPIATYLLKKSVVISTLYAAKIGYFLCG